MNKYLAKIAAMENPVNHPFKTAVTQSVSSIIPDIVGGSIGGAVGGLLTKRFGPTVGKYSVAAGTLIGGSLAGLGANYAVLKKQDDQIKQFKGQQK